MENDSTLTANSKALKVTSIQSDLVWENTDKNLQKFENSINSIENETDLIILPEMFTTGFSMKPHEFAEPENGKTLQWMQKIAEHRKVAITGSVIVKGNNRCYNRLFFVKPSGEYSCYNKRHLFRMGNEHKHYNAGSEKLIVNYKGWRILPLVCYDLRFPVWSRNINNEYDLLIYVANWPASRIEVWKTLLQARALENQCYCIGVNRVGNDAYGTPHNGMSMVVSYLGQIVNQFAENEEAKSNAILNLDKLNRFRQKFPAYLDADIFSIVAD